MKTYIILASTLAVALAAATFLSLPRAVQAAAVALIRDNDNAGRHPFQQVCTSSPGSNFCTLETPSNVETVIRNVSFTGSTTTGDTSVLFFLTAYSGRISGQPVSVVAPKFGSSSLFFATQPTWVALDPGNPFTCAGNLPGQGLGLTVSCTVSGYYVTLP